MAQNLAYFLIPLFYKKLDNPSYPYSTCAHVFEKLIVCNHFILLFRSPHVNGVFGPLGELLKIKAKSPLDGATATLEFHSLKSIMSRQPGCKELKAFPGPLVPGKTDKLDVIRYVFFYYSRIIFYWMLKGQLISKGLFGILNYSKKQTKQARKGFRTIRARRYFR